MGNSLETVECATVSNNKRFFTHGINVCKCELDPYLFCFYSEEEIEEDEISSDWIQLLIADIDDPNAHYSVSEGGLVFYNERSGDYFVAYGHQLVVNANEVEFYNLSEELKNQLAYQG